jgi:multidrug efflux pump subunit AcrA (membrane-fusion protein)
MVAAAIGLVLGLAIAGGTWWFVGDRASAQVATPTSITRTATAAVDTIQKTISTSGTLTPAVQQDVSFVASGTVTQVSASSGQVVSAGQALATVDTLTMQQTLADAKLSLAKAQATLVTDQDALVTAEDALTSAQDAGDDTTAEEATVTSAQQQVNVDQTSITTAQNDVDTAQNALNSATLTSPIDGVVSEVNVAVGDKITGSASGTSTSTGGTGSTADSATGSSGGSNSNPSTGTDTTSGSSTSSAAFVIVGTGSWKVDVTVDSAQIGLLAVGDQAKLTTDGSTESMFGTINSVGLISTSTSSTASYPVEVAVTGSPSGLHDGESMTVSLVYEQLTDVLTVPSAAIQVENGQSVVNRVDGDQQVSTVVQTGETDGTNTEIIAGLIEGDQVSYTVTLGGTGTGQGFPGGGELPTGGFPTDLQGFPDGGQIPTGGFVGSPQGGG